MNVIAPPWDSSSTMAEKRARCPIDASILGFFFKPALRVLAAATDATYARTIENGTTPRVLVPFLSYPMSDFLIIMGEIEGVLDPDTALTKVAQEVLAPFFGSPVGSIMFTLARTTPQTLIEASIAGYRACVSWGEREYVRVGDREALMHYKGDLLGPAWHAEGIFPPAILKACNVVATVTVEDASVSRQDFTLRTRW